MKKIISLLVISLFVMGGLVFADSDWTYENVQILGPRMGEKGYTPPVEIIKICTGSTDTAAVGDVMVWDTAPSDGSGLGYVVCISDRSSASGDVGGSRGKGPFAGVMVTVTSKESEWTYTGISGSDKTVGYMAVRGFCDAKVLTNWSTVGKRLVMLGAHSAGYFGTIDQTTSDATGNTCKLSEDIGYLLEHTSSDGLMKVWLR